MCIQRLKEDIKNRAFKQVYLLYGGETYLIEHYERQFRERVADSEGLMMNVDIFDGKVSVQSICDAASTLPFMSEYRVVIVKDSRLFISGRKEDSDSMSAFFREIPSSTVLVFIENTIDKRMKIYKSVVEAGYAAEMERPQDNDLVDWLSKIFKKSGKVISFETILYMLRSIGGSMLFLRAEADKVIAYVNEPREILVEDINAVCIKSLETRIFDLMDALGGKNLETALDIYSNLILMKESPIMILSMIIRQFRLMYLCRAMNEKGLKRADIVKSLSVGGFVVSQCLRQAGNFTLSGLLTALEDCMEADVNIKLGKITDRIAVEMILVKYASESI